MNARSQSTSSCEVGRAGEAHRTRRWARGGSPARAGTPARSMLSRRWRLSRAAVQRSANCRDRLDRARAPRAVRPRRRPVVDEGSIAAGSSNSDSTRLRGGVRIATATTRSPSTTAARIGGPIGDRGVAPERVEDPEQQVVLGLALPQERADAAEERARVDEPLQRAVATRQRKRTGPSSVTGSDKRRTRRDATLSPAIHCPAAGGPT